MTWRAVLLGGIISGIVFFALNSFFAPDITPNLLLRYIASLVMGSDVLVDNNSMALIVGVIVHFALSLLFSLIVAIVVHRWGLLVGIVGGGILGLAIYGINLYTLTTIFPWFFAINTPLLLISHIVFGMVAGGIYELFDHFDLPLLKEEIMMRTTRQAAGGSGGGLGVRVLMGLALVVFSIISYLGSQEFNPVTGENQFVSLTVQQEIALGLQAAPEMIREFGGLYNDQSVQNDIDAIGERLLNSSVANNNSWRFEFHVLADSTTINAFALPGGQVFITVALLSRLDTEDQVAGILAHEIVHVLARHSAQRIAKSNLTNGIVGAVGVASGDASAAQTAAMIGQLVNMQYGRDDELESDGIGVCLMIDAGYDPQGMVAVMEVLAEASSGNRQPEFFSTHPNPENRIQAIQDAITNASRDCPK